MRLFMKKVEKRDSGCWEWLGCRDRQGYGRLGRDGVNWFAHRFAYTHLVGPIPEGLTLDHLCRNTSCVNPEHLEPVTSEENTRRHFASLTHCKHGHEFTPENTYYRDGRRSCRACNRLAAARSKARRVVRRAVAS